MSLDYEPAPANIAETTQTGPAAPGLVTFPYDPPPAQSAAEFRKSFAESFQNTLALQLRLGSAR